MPGLLPYDAPGGFEAQLGELLNGIQEVRGSTPLASTTFPASPGRTAMTIARRLTLLLAVPLAILVGLGLMLRVQLREIEERSRFVALVQAPSLAALGNITRGLAEMRVSVRDFLMAGTPEARIRARAFYDADRSDLERQLAAYGDRLVSDDADRRMCADYLAFSRQCAAAASGMVELAEGGTAEEAAALLHGDAGAFARMLGATSRGWIRHNQDLADRAGDAALEAIEAAQTRMFRAVLVALMISGLAGWAIARSV